MKTITVQSEDLKQINGKRERKFRAIDVSLSDQVILEDIKQHNRKRVIVICNTVSQAQGLFKDLRNAIETEQFLNSNLETKLLHSRFLPDDRQEKEKDLETVFGKNWQKKDDGKCHILIATQVIEVGLNLTCEVMYSQLCPMSSLLQRAGRCARFNDEKGEVYIYREINISEENSLKSQQETEDVEEEKTENKRKFLPYSNQLCEDTWAILQKHNFNQPVDFTTEKKWINEVHTKEVEVQRKRRKNNRGEFEQQFENAIFRGDRSASRDLIRFVNNRNIFVTDDRSFIDSISSEQEINLDKFQPFSVPLTTLLKAYRDFEQVGHQTWLFKRIENPSGKDKESYKSPILSEITSSSQITSSIRILVNPEFIFYNKDIGLWINVINPEKDVENKYKSPNKEKKTTFDQYSYKMDTYLGHLGRMWTCWLKPFQGYSSVRDELLEAGGRFIKQYIFENVTQKQAEALFDILVFLAIVTHDLGKLQIKWQKVMRGWQKIAYEEFPDHKFTNPKNHLLAHTDYQPNDVVMKKRYDEYMKKNKRPPHAVESAFFSREILEFSLIPILENYYGADDETIEQLINVIKMASGRHHSAWTKGWKGVDIAEIEKIELHKDAPAEIQKSWRALSKRLFNLLPDNIQFPTELDFSQQLSYPVEVCQLNCFESDDWEYQQLYSLIVRALRLCDMRSVQLH